LMEVPVVATEQYRERMGGTHESLMPHLASEDVIGKMSFSCCGCGEFMDRLRATGRTRAILVGIETHICVSGTALDLLEAGLEVAVCPDAVSARSLERHKLGMERIRDAGAAPIHTEAVLYEWMRTAEHERFRDALKLVKEFQ
jgi:nicotinamidase-related amidase